MQIILLNMLIALMSNVYEHVAEISDQALLKELCSMISDHEYVLSRENEFKNTKYVILARLEKAEG